MVRGNIKKIIIVLLIMPICISFSRLYCLNAEDNISGGQNDVYITVEETFAEKYCYSFDIIYFNMSFTYRLESTGYNTETGERFVNSGSWVMDGSIVNGTTIEVTNHSDTPVSALVVTDCTSITGSGSEVSEEGLFGTILSACSKNGDLYYAESAERSIKFGAYPDYDNYSGIKRVYADVYVQPVDGIATNGRYFTAAASFGW